ncbi:hypothetical protein AN958_02855 [Leucoagaricus sp. SymC.cos]|nr:hypothetical protein AN958_02855 [Leucoagaricus sp. SymC.cos]
MCFGRREDPSNESLNIIEGSCSDRHAVSKSSSISLHLNSPTDTLESYRSFSLTSSFKSFDA